MRGFRVQATDDTCQIPLPGATAGGRIGRFACFRWPPKRGQGTSKSAFDIVIDRTLKASRNGVPYEVTVEEALQYRTYQQALAGKPHGNPGSYGWIQKREQWLD